MGNPEGESSQQYNDRQPAPSYSEEDQFDTPSAYTDQSVIQATTKFPPTLNGYIKWKAWKTIHLGPSADKKLWAVGMHSGGFSGKKPTIILHDGHSDKDAVLATAGSENSMQTRYIIIIPNHVRSDGENLVIRMSAPTIKTSRCMLSIPIGEKGKLEEFE